MTELDGLFRDTMARLAAGIKCEQLGLDVPEERQRELLAAVKRLGAEKRGLVTDEEFMELAR